MQNLRNIREDVKIPHSKMCRKKMLEDIGNLFVKCMRQAICAIFWGYQITMCGIGKGPFVKGLQRSPTGQLIPLDGSVNFCKKSVVRGREF